MLVLLFCHCFLAAYLSPGIFIIKTGLYKCFFQFYASAHNVSVCIFRPHIIRNKQTFRNTEKLH